VGNGGGGREGEIEGRRGRRKICRGVTVRDGGNSGLMEEEWERGGGSGVRSQEE